MENPIETIETAMVARLAFHNSTDIPRYKWGFKCKYIDSYGGQFETPEEFAQAAQRAPGLWVAYEGETCELANGLLNVRLNFAVFVLAKSFKPEELRRGGPNVVGLYQMLEAVRLALANQTLGLVMNPLELSAVSPLWRGGPQGGGISLMHMRFSTRVVIAVPPNVEIDEDICPHPFYVSAWDVAPLPIVTDIWGREKEKK